MAGRKPFLRGTKASQVLPIWNMVNTDLNSALFLSLMARLGVTSVSSYMRRFVIPNVLCALVGACIGLSQGGGFGAFAGALVGLATPAALIWPAVTLVHADAYLAIFCVAWVAILGVICKRPSAPKMWTTPKISTATAITSPVPITNMASAVNLKRHAWSR